MSSTSTAKIVPFPSQTEPKGTGRKSGKNKNREGSVRNINGKVYVDFIYLDERVRESSGLPWDDVNSKKVRGQLDKIIAKIKSGEFCFEEVFPNSKKKEFFTKKEIEQAGGNKKPRQLRYGEYFQSWLSFQKTSGNITGRTHRGYKWLIDVYLAPFFGDKTFEDLNSALFKQFLDWSKKRQLKGKPVGNATINKSLALLKCLCKSAAIDFGWRGSNDPFFGWKKLKEEDSYDNVHPFTLNEQQMLIEALPAHWKPYFMFAFATGLRIGEQIALKQADIDWEKGEVCINRAITFDHEGKIIEGGTKNRFSRGILPRLPGMMEALKSKEPIYRQFKGDYFFCNTAGGRIDNANLYHQVWIPALKRAGLEPRELRQTRHTFASIALALGETPGFVSKIMGHRDTEMIFKVYGKFVADAGMTKDGEALAKAYEKAFGKEG